MGHSVVQPDMLLSLLLKTMGLLEGFTLTGTNPFGTPLGMPPLTSNLSNLRSQLIEWILASLALPSTPPPPPYCEVSTMKRVRKVQEVLECLPDFQDSQMEIKILQSCLTP